MKRNTTFFLILIVCSIFLFASCSLMVKERVVYDVTGNTPAGSITYMDEDGGSVVVPGPTLPWQHILTITYGEDKELSEVSLSATSASAPSAVVTATITWSK
jgi:hypothetical protein